MICALLLGREGSTGFPGKNVVPVRGRPLMAYPLRAALSTPSVGSVYVSTDSPALKRLAGEHGASVIDRPLSVRTPTCMATKSFAICCGRMANRWN